MDNPELIPFAVTLGGRKWNVRTCRELGLKGDPKHG